VASNQNKGDTKLASWRMNFQLSGSVRRHFPALADSVLQTFLAITGTPEDFPKIEISSQNQFIIAPVENVCLLLNDEDTSLLSTMSKSKIPGGKSLVFRTNWTVLSVKHRSLMVLVKPPEQKDDVTGKSMYGKNIVKMKSFFSSMGDNFKFTTKETKEFGSVSKASELLYVTVLAENGKDDTIVAAIQFKREDDAVWINYIGTSPKVITVPVFGKAPDFPKADTPFRGMGLCLLLLRAVQLYQCCTANPPNLLIQVAPNTPLHKYLVNRGFQAIAGTPDARPSAMALQFIDFVKTRPGCVFKDDEELITLCLSHAALGNVGKKNGHAHC
jgi:hypothetical protein